METPLGAGFVAAGAGDSKPRLMIQKMVLENFKSYGGIREVGKFFLPVW